ncbi:MAG TPA: efflux RND transporter periplasmic adaptor subunit, partial [Pseudomonadales bacterium]|nr:efflux RND transporter periplasmic adaptor subunit [Pseudomonadales bacterium]
MNNKSLIFILLIVLGVGVGAGWLLGHAPKTESHTMNMTQTPAKPLYYRNPMNPAITSPVPAKDEMGMDYVPVFADDSTDTTPGTVSIDPVTIQDIGVRTTLAERGTLSHVIHAPGRVDYNEATLARLNPKVEGWAVKVYANETGQRVRKGESLLSIYSPNLVTTEQEYLLTLTQLDEASKSGSTDAVDQATMIVDAARQRLRLLDVPDSAIDRLATTRRATTTVDILSPFDGTVTKVGVMQGQHVSPSTELYAIADLSHVWVTVDVYEQDLPWIREGDVADIQTIAMPGETLTGKVTRVYPYMETRSRTTQVRLEFDNPNGSLKPGMFANAAIHADSVSDAILVPSEAIVRS